MPGSKGQNPETSYIIYRKAAYMSDSIITYRTEKIFTSGQIEELFLSVGWLSGRYPKRLHKALLNSQTVITAWDNNRLVGLARAIDDSEMVAFIHYVLVNPEYHGHGIASHMIDMIKQKYKDYLYIEVMPDESKNVPFYQKQGFHLLEDGRAMQISNIPK